MTRRQRLGRALALTVAVLTATTGCGVKERAPAAVATTSQPSISIAAPTGAGCESLLGAISVVDRPLSEALAAIPATASYAGLVAAAEGDLPKKLDGAVGLTVFVPVDEAFTTMTPETAALLADPAWVRSLIEYLVVPSIVQPADIEPGAAEALITLRGPAAPLTVTSDGSTLLLNGQAPSVCGPIGYASGVIYLIDELVLPPA